MNSFLFGLRECFNCTIGCEVQIGIVVIDDFVDLPESEMIGLQPNVSSALVKAAQ